jgi:hypothetical protein
MTIPSLVFAVLIASLLGALYHLIRGGGPGRLFLDLFLSWAGFALGHFVGLWRGWLLFPMGQLDVGLSILGSLILLVGVDWISHFRLGTDTFSNGDKGV